MSPPFIVGLTNSIKQNGWGKSNSSKQNGWGKSSRSTSPKNIRKGIVYETPLSTRKIKIPNLKLFSFAKLKSAAKSNSSKQNGSTKSNGSKSPKNNSWSIVSEISPPSTKERSPRELGIASSNGSKSSKNNSWSIINEISPPSTREKNPRNTDKSIINEISPSSSARIKTPNLKVFTFAGKSIINETSPSSSAGIKTPNLEVFTFAELKSATRNFSPDVVLGEGGFGRVFKGWICKYTYAPGTIGTGMAVAVKKSNPNGRQGLREWQSEIKFLGNLSHPNIIKLLGYCSEDKEYLLVYEFAQKGSLERHLFRNRAAPLPWYTRLKIAIGSARSLAFLHTSEKPIIYRDFKASNIMLDGDYNAKLSDFGLAIYADLNDDSQVTTQIRDMLVPTNGDIEVTTQISWASGDTQVTTKITGTSGSANSDTHVTSHISYSNGGTQVTTHIRRASQVTGTYGYTAPEYVVTGRLRVNSDVYSFGVVFLELLTGLRALDRNRPSFQRNLVDWAKPLLSHEKRFERIMDGRLEGMYPRRGAYRAAQLALKCLHSDPKCRPSMVEVLENLEKINAMRYP